MTDVYKVGISVSMTNMVSSVLKVIVKDLKLANVSATAFQRTLKEIKLLGMVGLAAGVTGGLGVAGLHKLYDAASEYQQALGRFKALNLGDAINKDADKFARGTQVIGASATDLITTTRDLTTVLGNYNLAKQLAPTFTQIAFANESMFGEKGFKFDHAQLQALEKIIEIKGGYKSPEDFINQANLLEKVYAGTGGMVRPSDYLQFIKTSGVSGRLLNNDMFYYTMEPLIQEMGGMRVGTGMMSAYNNLAQGRATVRAAREMMRLGLLDPHDVEYDKIGQVKAIHPGALKGFDQYTSDPYHWMKDVMIPALVKAGYTTQQQQINEMGALLGNRTGSNLFSLMLMQQDKIEKNIAISKNAMGVQDLIKLAQTTPEGASMALGKAWDNLKIAAGQSLIPVVIPVLNELAGVFRGLAAAMTRHPLRTEFIVRGIGAISVALLGLAAAMPFAMVYKMMQFVGVTKLIGTAFRGMGGMLAVVASPAVLFAAAVAAVGAAILLTMPSVKTFKEAWVELKDLIGRVIDAIMGRIHKMEEFFHLDSASVTPPRRLQPVHVYTNVTMDGRTVAQVVSKHQAADGDKPLSGPSGFDFRMSTPYAGATGN